VRLLGDLTIVDRVIAQGDASRLVTTLAGPAPSGRVDALRDHLLSWGDLLMIRKQLHTLRDLASGTC